jgi:hypothetical protein
VSSWTSRGGDAIAPGMIPILDPDHCTTMAEVRAGVDALD